MSAEARLESRTLSNTPVALARLETDGFIERRADGFRTTRRWQRAMARAAVQLYEAGDPGDDLRVPIAVALLEMYQSDVDDEALVDCVEAMLPIESASLGLVPDPIQGRTGDLA